jgi:hypothetical protein
MKPTFSAWRDNLYPRYARCKGEFGAYKPWICEECGEKLWEEPDGEEVERGTYYEPPKYDTFCPKCGLLGTLSETNTPLPIRLKRRCRLIGHFVRAV